MAINDIYKLGFVNRGSHVKKAKERKREKAHQLHLVK